jgi:hypothetical protein
MKTYIYYNKFDSSKEPQGKVQADNITEAIEKAATVKQMDIDSFLSIFDVKTDGKRKIQKLI